MTRTAWLTCGLVLVSRVLAWWLVPYATEDALITFRVARNWIETGFPSYNVGEHVGSVTSLPWTAWVSVGLFAQQDPVLWTRATGLVCDALVLWLVPRGTLPVFGLIYSLPIFSYASVSGLETPAVTAAVVAAARMPWANAMLACLRPEGLLAAAVNWRAPALIGLAMPVTSKLMWGEWFPTAQAKALVYGIHWFKGWLWVSPITPFDLGGSPVGVMDALEGMKLLAFPLIVLGVTRTFRGLWAPALAVLGTYWITGTSGFWWYSIPWMASLGAVAAEGTREIFLPWIIRGTAVAVLLTSWYPGFQAVKRTAYSELPLVQAAGWLVEHKASGTIFLEPVGHIGWANPGLRVIDEVGLVTPEIARDRVGPPGWWSSAVERYKPDWMVVRMEFIINPTKPWAGAGIPVVEGDQPAKNYAVAAQFGNVLILKRQ